MARRTTEITIDAEGRDKGKRFLLTEMAADATERWANRALLAFANAGGRLPDGILDTGAAGLDLSLRSLMVVGLRSLSGLSFDEIDPLLKEMVSCMEYQPPGNAPLQPIILGENSQIEEVSTWYKLRGELIDLHLGFSLADAISTSDSEALTPSA